MIMYALCFLFIASAVNTEFPSSENLYKNWGYDESSEQPSTDSGYQTSNSPTITSVEVDDFVDQLSEEIATADRDRREEIADTLEILGESVADRKQNQIQVWAKNAMYLVNLNSPDRKRSEKKIKSLSEKLVAFLKSFVNWFYELLNWDKPFDLDDDDDDDENAKKNKNPEKKDDKEAAKSTESPNDKSAADRIQSKDGKYGEQSDANPSTKDKKAKNVQSEVSAEKDRDRQVKLAKETEALRNESLQTEKASSNKFLHTELEKSDARQQKAKLPIIEANHDSNRSTVSKSESFNSNTQNAVENDNHPSDVLSGSPSPQEAVMLSSAGSNADETKKVESDTNTTGTKEPAHADGHHVHESNRNPQGDDIPNQESAENRYGVTEKSLTTTPSTASGTVESAQTVSEISSQKSAEEGTKSTKPSSDTGSSQVAQGITDLQLENHINEWKTKGEGVFKDIEKVLENISKLTSDQDTKLRVFFSELLSHSAITDQQWSALAIITTGKTKELSKILNATANENWKGVSNSR